MWSQRIISGLSETFTKRYIVERTSKAEIRPEEQSEKAESCRENVLHLNSHTPLTQRNRTGLSVLLRRSAGNLSGKQARTQLVRECSVVHLRISWLCHFELILNLKEGTSARALISERRKSIERERERGAGGN